jgi:hypothetical protein
MTTREECKEAMRQMEQSLADAGTLSDGDGTARAVHFKFDIVQELVTGPGGQQALGKARTRGGNVSADDGQTINEGIYRLVDSNGKALRVQKLGMQWFLLSPPTG